MADDNFIIRGQVELDIAKSEKRIAYLGEQLKKAMEEGNLHNIDALDAALDKEKSKLADLKKQWDDVNKKIEGSGAATKESTEQLSVMDNVAGGLAKTMAAVFSVKAAKDFITQIANVRGQFQQYEVAMETLLGNKDKADKLMADSIALAAKTPFYVSDVVGGAKQLLAYGHKAEDVTDTLRRLGDIASGVSIPLNRVIGIYGRIMAQGKLTNLTMKQFYSSGIPIINQLQTQLGKTKEEIMKMISAGKISFEMVKQAFTDMTNEGGKFGNMMEKQSHTITGHINVIKGLIQNMFNELGKDAEGPIEKVLQGVENLIKNYEKWGKTLAPIILTLGGIRAAEMAYVAIVKLSTTSLISNSVASYNNAMAMIRNATTTKQAAAGQAMLNKAILSNPYVMLATVVAAATAGIIAYARANDFALQAQKRLDKGVASAAAAASSEISELNKLRAKMETATKGTEDYDKARSELISKFGKYYDGLDKELDKVDGLAKVYGILTEKINESANARAYNSYMEKLQEEQTKALEKQYDSLLKQFEEKYGKGSIEAYSKFFSTIKELTSESGLSEEMQNEIDGMKKALEMPSNLAGSGYQNVFWKWMFDGFGAGVNEAQTVVDKINDIQTAAGNAGEAAKQAFGLGAQKSELEKTIENLSDADLSSLIKQLQDVKEEVMGLSKGSMRTFNWNNVTYGFQRSVDANNKPVVIPYNANGYSDQGNTLLDLAEEEKKNRRNNKNNNNNNNNNGGNNSAEQAAARRIRARKAEERATEAVNKAIIDAQAKAQEEEIDLMEEGLAKKLARANFEKEQRLRQIEEEKKQFVEKLKAKAQAEWKAAHPDSKGEWDDKTFKLTPEQSKLIEDMYGEEGTLRENATKNAEKTIKGSLDAQLKEYGDFYQKRTLTAQEWNKKIEGTEKALTEVTNEEEKARLQAVVESMRKQKELELAEADYNLVSEYGGANQKRDMLAKLWEKRIEAAAPEMRDAMERASKRELSQLDVEMFKDAIDWDAVFGDMGEQSTKALERNLANVQKYLDANRSNMDVEQIRDIEEALASLSDEIANRNPFEAIGVAITNLKSTRENLPQIVKDYQEALRAFAEAEKEYKAEMQQIDEELAAGNVTDERRAELTARQVAAAGKLDNAQEKLKNSTQDLNKAQSNITRNAKRVIQSMTGIRDSVRSSASNVADFVGVFDEDMAEVINEAINLFSELGDTITEITEKLTEEGTSLVEGLQQTAEGTADAVQGTAEATSAAIQAVEAASVVLLVIKAVIVALTAVFRILKANDEAERMSAEAAREYAQALRELDDAARLNNLSTAFGDNALARFREAKQIISELGGEIEKTVAEGRAAFLNGLFPPEMQSELIKKDEKLMLL